MNDTELFPTDQPDLFPVAESLSPFAKWKREHHVTVNYNPTAAEDDRWYARCGWAFEGTGASEDDACTALAESACIKDWRGI